MAYQEQSTRTVTPVSLSIPPAQLWLGAHEALLEKTVEFLQKTFCTRDACATCTTCRKIREQQFHAAVWLYPEKSYTLDYIKTMLQPMSFALPEKQHFFFILQKADFLTTACANSLLKSVEEPPTGYHFIFLAQRQEHILPTIRSRCITTSFYSAEQQLSLSPLFNLFTLTTSYTPADFLKLLGTLKITERETIEIIDGLLQHWLKKYNQSLVDDNAREKELAGKMVGVMKEALKMPPMPGGSKLFWKNLFLKV